MVKNLTPVQEIQETQVWSLGQEDPLEEERAPHSSILAWKIPWMEEPGGLQFMGPKRVRHHWAIECIRACDWLSLKFVIGPFVFQHTFMLFLVSTGCLGIATPENGFPNNELWNHSSANFFLAYCSEHSLLNSTIMFFGGGNTRPLKLILILSCR